MTTSYYWIAFPYKASECYVTFMPRGSGKNIGRTNILTGQPVSEDASGNIRLADAAHVAFAVAATGTPAGGVVTWQTDSIITRTDWSHITGSKELIPGQRYYVLGTGLLSTSGFQQIGVARSNRELRIEIGVSSAVQTVTSTSSSSAPPLDLTSLQAQVTALQSLTSDLQSQINSLNAIIGSILFSGSGAPSITPMGSDKALYIDTASGSLYQWYDGVWH